MLRPRKREEARFGTLLTPPSSRFPGERPLGTLPQIYDRLASSTAPTGEATNHPCSAEHRRGLGLLPTRAPTTTPNQENEAAAAATAPARGSENTDRSLAAGEAHFDPAPLPTATRSPPRPSPRAPPARPTVACGRTSHQLLFSSPGLGGVGVASGWPENGPAAQPAGYQPPGHFPQQLQLLPVFSRPPPASRASQEGEEGGQGRGCEESSSRLWGVAAEAGSRCGDPSCSHRWDFQSS